MQYIVLVTNGFVSGHGSLCAFTVLLAPLLLAYFIVQLVVKAADSCCRFLPTQESVIEEGKGRGS